MGGQDKGLQPFRGEPLVAHVLRCLAPQVGTLLISANRHHALYASFGHPVVVDGSPDQSGPLAGVLAGLVACRSDLLAVVPCDVPFAPADLVRRLATELESADVDVAVPRTASGLQPAFCLMRRTVRDDLAGFLDAGGRAMHRWIERLNHRAVSFDDEQAFVNLNTLDELHAAEGRRPSDA